MTSVDLGRPSELCLAPAASFEVSAGVPPPPAFVSSSGGSSASGAEESSLSGVEALDALSTSVLPSTLASDPPSVSAVVVVVGSPSGSSVDGKAGDVLSGGGVNGEVGSVASVGLADAGGSEGLVS